MKNKMLLATILLFAIAACKFSQKQTGRSAPSIATTVSYPMLDSTDIFDSAKVANWHPTVAAATYAQKLYLNAIDLYANQQKAVESLPLFLRSLRVAPNAYTYLKYGEALTGVSDPSTALGVFDMAMYDRNVRPFAEMGKARTLAHFGAYNTLDVLGDALDDYPFDVNAIAEDTAFNLIKDMEEFKLLLAKHSASASDRKKVMLKMFAANFTKSDLPYNIPDDSLRAERGVDIDYLYTDIIQDLRDGNRAFSRMVDKTYQYVAEVNVSPDYHTFIYRAINFYDGPDQESSMPPEYYYVATVDSTGGNIDLQMIACFCSPVSIQTAWIDSAGVIEVKAISQVWKYNPVDSGYYGNNQVSKQELKGTTYFRIKENGKIERLSEKPVNAGSAEANAAPKTPEVQQWQVKEYNSNNTH